MPGKRHGKSRGHRKASFSGVSSRVTQESGRKAMTLKQNYILISSFIGICVVDAALLFLAHGKKDIFPILLSMGITMSGCYLIGRVEHKWKRDKEMAGFIAERLMGKQAGTMSSGAYTGAMTRQGIASTLMSQSQQQASSLTNQINNLLGGIGGSGMGKQ